MVHRAVQRFRIFKFPILTVGALLKFLALTCGSVVYQSIDSQFINVSF